MRKIYHFIHESGLEERCRQHELTEKYHIDQSGISMVVTKRRPSYKGWRLFGKPIPKSKRIHKFIHVDGSIEECTQQELIKKYKLPQGSVSGLVHKKVYATNGWMLFGRWEK